MQIVDPLNVGIAKRAFRSARHCGDHGGVWSDGGRLVVALADGLGHGEEAEEAARLAIDFVEGHPGLSFQEVFEEADSRLRASW